MTNRRHALKQIAAGAATLGAPSAFAQVDQTPITVLVGAASSMDFTARLIAEQLRDALGRPAVVLSKLGAGQRVALGTAKRAAPDGRTLVFATDGPFTIYPHIYTKLDYDPVADFSPIIGVSYFDVAVSTNPQTTGANDMKGLVDWARAQQGKATFGSAPGNGSLSHFVGINIGLATNIGFMHVPYKDSGVGLVDLAAGRLPMMITGLAPQVELHKAGKIKILAISGDKRSPLVPDVPTLKEAGVNVSTTTATGVFGPAKIPQDMVMRLHDAILPMLSNTTIRDKLASQGMTVWHANPPQLSTHLEEGRKRFAALVKASGYKAEPA